MNIILRDADFNLLMSAKREMELSRGIPEDTKVYDHRIQDQMGGVVLIYWVRNQKIDVKDYYRTTGREITLLHLTDQQLKEIEYVQES